ncbi:MAG: methionyl-tRNA formyltransferase [Proteobacteria bacterium]|nr:methionyl-tRNA formyltransferase [Pseudomonadota bacterium]
MDTPRPLPAATPLRVGFAGTPDFAAAALTAIIEAGYTIPCVLTQPDRPKGRGMALATSPVKARALAHGLPVLQPPTLRDAAARAALADHALDVLVVAAYGLILPQAVLDTPRAGCLNIHASLLPRWRGAAPIARAIEAGDTTSGITIMQMDAGLDTGPVIAEYPVPVAPDATAATLHDTLAALGARAVVDVLATLARDGRLASRPQAATGITYAHKITRQDARLDWTLPAPVLARRVRAFDPVPGAWADAGDGVIKVWRADARAEASRGAAPGTLLAIGERGLVVACGDGGALAITELTPAGGRRMSAAAYAAGAGRAHVVGVPLGSTR